MIAREQQRAVAIGLAIAGVSVMLLPVTGLLELKAVGVSLAAALMLVFKGVVLLSDAQETHMFRRNRLFEWFLAAYLCILIIATFVSPYPDAGLLDIERNLPVFILAIFAHNLEPDAEGRRLIVSTWLFGASMVALYAILQRFGIEIVEVYALAGSRDRAMGTYGNPTFLAGFLIATWPLCLLAWARGWRRAAVIASLLMAAALLSTESRAGMLALVFQAVLGGGMIVYLKKKAAKTLGLILAGLALLALAAVIFLPESTWTRPTQRLELWSASMELWLNRPFLGWGPGSYPLAMQEHLPAALRQSLESSRQFAEHPHSWILSYLCRGGILLLLSVFVLIGFSLVGPLAELQRASRDHVAIPEAGRWSLAIALGLVGLLIQNLFDRNLELAGSAFFFWVYLGWLAPQGPPQTTRIVDLVLKRILGIVLLGFAALTVWTGSRPVADYFELKKQGDFLEQNVEEAPSEEKEISQYLFENPQDAGAWQAYGQSLAKQRKFQQAVQAYEQALKLNPESKVAMLNLGNCYFMLNRYPQALAMFKDVARHDPKDADAYFNMGYVYFYMNKLKLANDSLKQALKLDSGHAGARKLQQQILGQ